MFHRHGISLSFFPGQPPPVESPTAEGRAQTSRMSLKIAPRPTPTGTCESRRSRPEGPAAADVAIGDVSVATLCQNALHHVAGDVGEAEIAPLVLASQARMVDTQEVKHRGVSIVNADGVLHRVVVEVVGFAVRDARLDAAASHPYRVAADVVIAPIARGGGGRLARARGLSIHRSSKLAAPHDKRVLEHPPLFQVLDQRRRSLVDIVGTISDQLGQVVMVIPAPMRQLNESHASFSQPPRQQAIASEGSRRARLLPVELEGAVWLLI